MKGVVKMCESAIFCANTCLVAAEPPKELYFHCCCYNYCHCCCCFAPTCFYSSPRWKEESTRERSPRSSRCPEKDPVLAVVGPPRTAFGVRALLAWQWATARECCPPRHAELRSPHSLSPWLCSQLSNNPHWTSSYSWHWRYFALKKVETFDRVKFDELFGRSNQSDYNSKQKI